ncbi:hypothetical protein BCV72DRAFT_217668, partial [Rhizopus microsporus var. microsporus]
VVFALVVGRVTITRMPFLDQALERFILISKADSLLNTQFDRKFMSVFSHLQTQLYRSSTFAGLFLSIEWRSAFFNERLHSLLIKL